MFRGHILPTALFLVWVVAIIASSSSGYAQRRERERERRRERVVAIERGARTRMVVQGREYFYGEGKFYVRGPRGYVVAAAPVGARLGVLAPGFVTVRIGRMPLFLSFGTYYRFDPIERVYVVVSPPPHPPDPGHASQGNFDKLNLSNGETVTGVYLGGSPDTIQVQIGNDVQGFAVDDIKSIQFAPPPPK